MTGGPWAEPGWCCKDWDTATYNKSNNLLVKKKPKYYLNLTVKFSYLLPGCALHEHILLLLLVLLLHLHEVGLVHLLLIEGGSGVVRCADQYLLTEQLVLIRL